MDKVELILVCPLILHVIHEESHILRDLFFLLVKTVKKVYEVTYSEG